MKVSAWQEALMVYDPVSGEERPYPSYANHYREYHGTVAWLYNPWTGTKRDARDIGSDVMGLLIMAPREPAHVVENFTAVGQH